MEYEILKKELKRKGISSDGDYVYGILNVFFQYVVLSFNCTAIKQTN